MNERSILISSAVMSASMDKEEYPVPKSSIDTRVPTLRSIGKTWVWNWFVAIKASSVTSTMKRSAHALAFRVSTKVRMNFRSPACLAATLMAIDLPGRMLRRGRRRTRSPQPTRNE